MNTRPLGRTGLQVSTLGFGASSLGGVFHAVDETDTIRRILKPVTHIDWFS